jgi:two-component system, LytTR family, response regulator LytT
MTILIVEDEQRSARLLQALIEKARPDAQVLGICESVEETVHYLQANTPNLLFMDIELSDGNSLEVFRQVTVKAPVVFCTAYDDYMLDAFRVNGIAYLLKPVEEADIRSAFGKLDTIKQVLMPDVAALEGLLGGIRQSSPYNSSFLVRNRDKMVPVLVEDIAAISFENEVPFIYTSQSEKHALFKTMDEIEASLDPGLFFRINRQMIVHRRSVVAIEPYFNRKVTLTLTCKTTDRPVVSRLKVTPFLTWIEK